jgi:hypothetical protein
MRGVMIVEEGKEVKEVKDKERSSKMGRIPPTRQFSQEWQIKDLSHTENGRVYGTWKWRVTGGEPRKAGRFDCAGG